jgi:hypothetical protein
MNSYKCSNGDKISKKNIDKKVFEAKKNTLKQQKEEYGYNFCEDCKNNGTNTFLDCSHTISVDKCQKEGKSELTWDLNNIKIRCRECHQKLDKTNIQFK